MKRRHFLRLFALGVALAAAQPSSAAEEKKKAGGETYLPFAAVSGSTNKSGGRRGILSVECGIDVPDAKLRERASLSLPRLRAAYVLTIQAYAAGLPSGTAPSLDYIAKALQRQTDAILGKPGARVLLGAVLVN
jgi:hypothetical protein